MELTDIEKINLIIQDSDFITWVLSPTESLDTKWNQFVSDHPEQKPLFDEARILVKGIVIGENGLNDFEVEELLERIHISIHQGKKNTIRIYRWIAAACMIFIITVSVWYASVLPSSRPGSFDFSSVDFVEAKGKDITLILSDNTSKTFTKEEIEILYGSDGRIIADTEEVAKQPDNIKNLNEDAFNQLVVPFGKRSNIILSDGTRLWLNSGSRAIYPVTFNRSYREIFIEGEAYLEVAHDSSKPFFVSTEIMQIKVLGTKFNINSYPDNDLIEVALVEGRIQATSEAEKVVLNPKQLLSVDRQTGKSIQKEIDVIEYVSWKEGWLHCNKEKLAKIIPKLSRYYNIKIEVIDSRVNDLTLSGKLDLKTNCEEVLNTIASTAPIRYEIMEDVVRLSMND